MVMMAGWPIIDTPTPPADPTRWKDSRRLAFRSLDGQDLLPFTGHEFIARKGATGLDLPPRDLVESTVPGMDGSRIDDILVGSRKVFLPLFLGSDSSHRHYLDKRGELARLFNHRRHAYRDTGGTFDLVANSVNGERYLRCLYTDGMEGDTSYDQAGNYWESLGLNLLAVQPYWRGADWTTPLIMKPANVGWMSGQGTTIPWPGRLSSSRALGENIPVTVEGDVDSWPRVDVTGPADAVIITGEDLSVTIPNGLAAGETAAVITDPRDRDALFNGTRDWSRIAPSDRYAPLPPGEQKIDVVVVGAEEGTSARISGGTFYERWS